MRKGASEMGVKLIFFTFLLTFFVGTLIKSINYCQSVPLDHLYEYCENFMSGFSAFFLNLSKSRNILFRSMSNWNFLFSSASIVIGLWYLGDKTQWCMNLEWWKCNIYPRPALNEISLCKKPTSNWVIFILTGQWTSTGSSKLDYSEKNPNRAGGKWLRI